MAFNTKTTIDLFIAHVLNTTFSLFVVRMLLIKEIAILEGTSMGDTFTFFLFSDRKEEGHR